MMQEKKTVGRVNRFHDGGVKIWLTHPENRAYDGDYQIEIRVNGVWKCEKFYFEY